MFISESARSYYTASGEQRASGRFLAVFNESAGGPLWGIVRHCKLKQLGHWMVGQISIGGHKITVSGCYGADGLPMDLSKVPEQHRHLLIPAPDDLIKKFWAGGGHNTCGREDVAMWEWGKTIDRTKRRVP